MKILSCLQLGQKEIQPQVAAPGTPGTETITQTENGKFIQIARLPRPGALQLASGEQGPHPRVRRCRSLPEGEVVSALHTPCVFDAPSTCADSWATLLSQQH